MQIIALGFPGTLVYLLAGMLLQPVNFQFLLFILLIVFLLFISALISGAEVAMFSLKTNELRSLRDGSRSNQRQLAGLIENPKKLLATLLIANNFVNVSIIILSTLLTINWLDLSASPLLAFIIQVVFITFLILLFGEITPKVLATSAPLRFSLALAPFVKILSVVFTPLSLLLVRSTAFIDKRIARKGYDVSLSELSRAIEITTPETTPEEEKKLLKGIIKFGNIDVKEIMKPRIDVSAIDINSSFAELVRFIVDSGYSRIPVYEDSFDHVRGVLYIKDVLSHLGQDDDFEWKQLVRPAFFVPENKRINDLLQEFREKKIHIAIVVDEYGGTSGVVTLEDVIEEIVGEINDEFDVESEAIMYSKLDENNYIFEGKTLLNDFCKIIGIDDKLFENVKGESDTLAGLLLELTKKIPDKDEIVRFGGFVFKVEAVDKRRIKRIKVTLPTQSDSNE